MNGRHYNYQYSNKHTRLAIWFFVLLGILFALGLIFRPQKLISPLDGIDLTADFRPAIAEAHEPDVTYKCSENVEDYLNCLAVKGEITWKEAEILIAIGKAESGLNPNATHVNKNGSIDRGIFQINSCHKSLTNEDAFNWKKNADFAIKLMKKQGFTPWVVYKTGAYKLFLNK